MLSPHNTTVRTLLDSVIPAMSIVVRLTILFLANVIPSDEVYVATLFCIFTVSLTLPA